MGAGRWAQGAQLHCAPKRPRLCTQVGCSRVTWVHDRCSFTGHGRVWANQPFSECLPCANTMERDCRPLVSPAMQLTAKHLVQTVKPADQTVNPAATFCAKSCHCCAYAAYMYIYKSCCSACQGSERHGVTPGCPLHAAHATTVQCIPRMQPLYSTYRACNHCTVLHFPPTASRLSLPGLS